MSIICIALRTLPLRFTQCDKMKKCFFAQRDIRGDSFAALRVTLVVTHSLCSACLNCRNRSQ